jgi:hypothetical protein
VHTTETNKIEDFILVFEKEEQGRIKLQSLCQAGNPYPRAYLQQTQNQLICTIQLIDEGIGFCHFIDPWHLENTNRVTRKHNWIVELQLISYIYPNGS